MVRPPRLTVTPTATMPWGALSNERYDPQTVYDPTGRKLALMSGSTLTKAFIPLPSGAEAVYTSSGLAYYRHKDWRGSSTLATTPSRTKYYDVAYAPFGESYNPSGTTDLNFTGDNQDMLAGLFDTPNREYPPNQGRWISPDPAGLIAVDATNPQTWNRYAYVMNNPLALVDPSGLDDCEYDGIVLAWITDDATCAQEEGATWVSFIDPTISDTVDAPFDPVPDNDVLADLSANCGQRRWSWCRPWCRSSNGQWYGRERFGCRYLKWTTWGRSILRHKNRRVARRVQ